MNEVRCRLYYLEYPPPDNVYFGQGRKLPPRLAKRPGRIKITGEPKIFTQSDMDVSNFGVDKQGRTVVFDLAQIMRLPKSFACYTMASKDSFIADVAKFLNFNLSDNSNLDSMAQVSGCLWMMADPKLGAMTFP